MKKFRFLFAMLVMVTALGFTACSDDEEDTDVREQAIGNYSITTTLYVEDEGKLVSFASELSELAEALGEKLDENDFKITGTASVSKDGSNKLLVNFDGDKFLLNNIREASNGFVFDVEATTVDDVHFTNYSGYHLEGETKTYGGGYIASNKKLEFYIYSTMEEVLDASLDEETEDALAELLVAAGYTEEEAKEDAKQKVVFEFTLTKK
ncbi:MAG: hypothetical protein IIU03_06585 [Bacteroidales bacterium]|nr:hypothetical protein [Bacteroidales bacterium]